MTKPIIYIMGVSGSGKSTIGKMLSEKTGIPFFDGDDFHPEENVQKMASGQPLNDHDRQGWLAALNTVAKREEGKNGAIIGSSALKKKYRDMLTDGLSTNVHFVYLKGDFKAIFERLRQRGNHFMPPSLLQSQFDSLEPPSDALTIDIENKPSAIVNEIINTIL